MGSYSPYELPLPVNKLTGRMGFDGDHILISQDQSIFREGSHSMLTAGSATATIWGIAGSQPVMKYWCHNTGIDANGRFLPRDENDACSLLAFCEDNTVRYFGAPTAARGTLPVWTEFLRINILTGAVTFQSAGVTINNPANTFAYTLTAAAIVANRILNLPLITATDTLMCLGLAQTMTAALTMSGATFTPAQTQGIVGTTTNNSAQAGSVGELLTATAAPAAVALTTTVAANATSVSLTAGDWDVSGCVNYTPGATTSISALAQGASSTTATLPAQDSYAQLALAAEVPGAVVITQPIPTQRFSLSGTTTVFLVARATFTVSTLSAGGTIRARRIR